MDLPEPLRALPPEKLEAIRHAIQLLEAKGVKPSVPKVRRACGIGQNTVALVVRHYKRGDLPRGEPWRADGRATALPRPDRAPVESPLPAGGSLVRPAEGELLVAELADLWATIEGAADYETIASCAGRVASLIGRGDLSHQQGNAVRLALSEKRRAIEQHHKAHPPERDERAVTVCSPEGLQLVRSFEGLVSDERRLQILELAVELVEEDLADPSVRVSRQDGGSEELS